MKIIWTNRALISYFKIADYLKEEWGETVTKNFEAEVERTILKISESPLMFKTSKKYKNVRKDFITKHNTLFYRVKPRKNIIEILIFWDNRQDDNKSPY